MIIPRRVTIGFNHTKALCHDVLLKTTAQKGVFAELISNVLVIFLFSVFCQMFLIGQSRVANWEEESFVSQQGYGRRLGGPLPKHRNCFSDVTS